jgi:hypothetical protein
MTVAATATIAMAPNASTTAPMISTRRERLRGTVRD